MNLSLYLNVDETDPRLARVVSLTDLSRLPLPIFNFGDRLNVSVYLVTSAGAYLPYVFMGSLVFESFFGIPGLGAFVIEAITGQDFAIVRSMVFLGALLYILSYVVIDLTYTWADPRVTPVPRKPAASASR